MDDAPLAAVHGAEVERDARFLDALGRRQRAHPQFFNAQDAVIVGVETNAGMFLRRRADRFHRQLLQRQQQFCFIGQQQFDIRPGEADHQVGIFKIRVRRLALRNREIEIEVRQIKNRVEKILNARTRLRQRIFLRSHRFQFLPFFLGVGFTSTTAGFGVPRFSNHC